MKEDKFIKQNSNVWQSLENTLKKLQSKGLQRFGRNELNGFIALYNRICGHLSYSRTYYGNTGTTTYLNRLVASAHSFIYTVKTSNLKKLVKFQFKEFPALVRQNINYFWLSTGFFMLGALLSFIYILISPDNAIAFLPRDLIEGFNSGGSPDRAWDSSIMSSFILTNNIRVGFTAFALGATLGIGTAIVLVYNGFILGGVAALAYSKGASMYLWPLILPHGIFELFAIFVCGGAGLMIGYSIINTGNYSRKDSLIIRGRPSVKLVCGTILIFVVAGLIEGFITPSSISETSKLLFAAGTFVVLIVYLLAGKLRHNSV